MKGIKFIIGIILLIAAFTACQKDIILKDITNEYVTTLSPPDGANTPNNNITFWWEKIEGAEKYQMQIVSPSFSNIQQLIVDTNITGDKFNKILTPGTYQWRIRATNGGGSTIWTTRTLTIDTSSNLAYAAVQLYSPADSFYSNATSLTLTWLPVSNATMYTLNVDHGLVNNVSYSTTSATVSFPGEDTYVWSVRAENAFSFTPYSTRRIIIDRTAPAAPTLSYPGVNATNIPADTMLRWAVVPGSYKDVVSVSTDSFATSANTIVMGDSVSNAVGSFRSYAFTNFNPTSGSTYFWRVKSVDKAKNASSFGEIRRFRVQ